MTAYPQVPRLTEPLTLEHTQSRDEIHGHLVKVRAVEIEPLIQRPDQRRPVAQKDQLTEPPKVSAFGARRRFGFLSRAPSRILRVNRKRHVIDGWRS